MLSRFRSVALLIAFAVSIGWASQVHAQITITNTNPTGTNAAPFPSNMALGASINVSGTFAYGSVWDPYVTSVGVSITGPDGLQYYSGNSANFDPSAQTYSQLFVIPSTGPTGTWRVMCLAVVNGRPVAGSTTYFAVPVGGSNSGGGP